MSENSTALPEITVEAPRMRSTGRRDHDAGYENDPAAAAGPIPPDNELTLTVDGKVFGGWDTISVTRSCESMPSAFNISLTERYPNELAKVVIRPGLLCTVKMGKDLVFTGYIDRYCPSLDANRHSVRILGRSRVQDLVDCSVIFDTFQISGQTVGAIAATLAGKYGIKVLLPAGEGPAVPQINLLVTDTVRDVLERICAFAKFLYYDDPDGNLVLRPVSEEKHASGIKQGANLLAANIEFSMDGRFSEYLVYSMTTAALFQAEEAAGGSGAPAAIGQAKDLAVERLRRRSLVLEHGGPNDPKVYARERAEWEQGRRAGRSEAVTVLVDSWRDSKGMLWEPNRLATVDVPSCKIMDQTWIIAEVTYVRGDRGTVARLVLMPPRAFDPQYDPLVPFNWQLAMAADKAAGQADAAERGRQADREEGMGEGR